MKEMPKTLIIVPCYNEEKRIPLDEFSSYDEKNISFLFANDGSTDKTSKILHEISKNKDNFYVYDALKNEGKAEVIRHAYKYALSKEIDFEWIAYWDADLSIPLYEIKNMFLYKELIYKDENYCAIWASRISREGSDIKKTFLRGLLGKSFVALASALLQIETYDPQCGAKIFSRDAASIAFKEKYVSLWIFDTEIRLRLKDKKILEYPLKSCIHVEGSKINVFQEGLRALKDLLKIYKKYK